MSRIKNLSNARILRSIPDLTDESVLRHVRLGESGPTLLTWDTGLADRHDKSQIGYAFTMPGETLPLFAGADFYCPSVHAIDSDECLRSLLTFLTLRPGDTDADYFVDYTEDQLDFANTEAESLSVWADRESAEHYPFVDL